MNTNSKTIGRQIQLARKARKLTVEQLSEKVGIGNATLGHIECGSTNPSLRTLLAIADALDVSLDFLAGRSEVMEITGCHQDLKNNSNLSGLSEQQKQAVDKMIQSVLPFIKDNF